MTRQEATPALTGSEQGARGTQSVNAAEPPGTKPPTGIAADESQPRCRVTKCTLGTTTETYLTTKELLALNVEDVDFHHDRVFGRVGIREPNGNVRKYFGEIPGLGPDVGLPFLEDILWAMGELISAEQLNGSIRNRWNKRNTRDRQVARLRKAFGDTAPVQHFFVVRSRPWRIAWNIARSWRIVERR